MLRSFIFLTILLAALHNVQSAPPLVSSNSRYTASGVINALSGGTSWTVNYYTVTFPSIVQGATTKSAALTLETINVVPASNYIDFEGRLIIPTNGTYFQLVVDSPMANSFTALVFRYIFFVDQYAADNTNLVMQFLRLNVGGVEVNNATEYWTYHTLPTTTFNITGGVTSRISMVGTNMTAITPNLFTLGVVAEMANSTTVTLFILPPVNDSNYKVTLHRLSIYIILFNTAFYNQANFATWTPDTWRIINQTSATYSNTTILDQSTMASIRWFSFSGMAKWDIGITFTNHTQLDFVTTNTNTSFGYDILILQTLYCPSTTAYFDSANNNCITSCAAPLYQN